VYDYTFDRRLRYINPRDFTKEYIVNVCRRSAVLDVIVNFDEELRETIRSFLQALECVEALYHMQNTDENSPGLEDNLFQKIIETLKRGVLYLSAEEKLDLERKVDRVAQGIRDLYPITLKHKGEDYIDLIIGKIFSSDKSNRACYSGAIGVINKSFDNLIASYDEKLDFFLERLPISEEYRGFSVKGNAPLMRCIDVFSLAGELNVRHKPICVFFSGGGYENLSTLSMMTVFINVYVRRFQLISKEIARKYVENYLVIEDLDYETIAKLLLLWLRGHDIGHFYGVDSLKKRMYELDKNYLILHELKSDAVALYNLRYIANDLLKNDLLIKAYTVAVSEMFRYIRRGKFYNYPDTASAFLAYMYFKEMGSIEFDARAKKFKVKFDKLEADIKDLNTNLLRIFAEGDVRKAKELVNRWGDIKELGHYSLPDELGVLEDTDIPHYIDLNFVTRDGILYSD
jgi:hypothetical protein